MERSNRNGELTRLSRGLGQTVVAQQGLLITPDARSVSDRRVDERLDGSRAKTLGYAFVETIHEPTLDGSTDKELERIVERFLREIRHDQLDDLFDVLLRRVNDCVRTRVKRVRRLALATFFERNAIVLCHDSDDRPTDVVHVKNGRVSVECDGVELVRVFHRYGCECVKIAVLDGLGDVTHAAGDDSKALWEEGRGLDGPLHAGSGGSAFFVVGDDADEGVHVGPVGFRCDLFGERVGAVSGGAFSPCDESAKERTAGRTGALTSNEGEFFRRCGKLVQLREGVNESCKARCGRCETGGSGEVIVRTNVHLPMRELHFK